MEGLAGFFASAPIANLLIVLGAGFLLIAVVGRIAGKLEPGSGGRVAAGIIGAIFIVLGFVMHGLRSKAGESGTESGTTTGSGEHGQQTAHLVLDLIDAAPQGRWSNGIGGLPWSGSTADANGFALWVENAQLEDGSTRNRVLEMHPQWVPDGQIQGEFVLPRPARDGDVFHSQVGFLQGAGGAVEFVVEALGGTLPNTQTVARVTDSAQDGQLKRLDADLTLVAGARAISLVVRAGPSSGQDWAVWVDPRIEAK